MADSNPLPTPPTASADARSVDEQLADLRQNIDRVDRELLALLNQRARLAQHVGEVKKIDGSPVFRPDREAQVIDGLKAANLGPVKADSIAPIWREIMSACRSLEGRLKVAYLGPAGTFSEQAAQHYFGSSIDWLPCGSIDEVFRSASAGSADFGVVPVENSTEGVVARSLDLLLQSPLTIVGETSLMVTHHLLRQTPSFDHIEAVVAHPQALAQCQAWLSQNLPHAERRPVSSNAEGARLAAQDARLAALASDRAASQYGLHVVRQAIQDDAHNRTRFVIVTLPARHTPAAPTGHDCTSLIVSVHNRPGAVHDMLVPLKQHGVSMTRLESRPARSGQWEYVFYMDLVGHPQEPALAAALDQLRAQCNFFKVLGHFPLDTH